MDHSNSVHLKWNKHQATLVSLFHTLLDNEKLTDCTISAEGQHIRAHKIILSACSPYFEKLFSENYEKYPIIILHDVKYNVAKALMDFMYHGEVNVPEEELNGILNISESLQIRGLSGSGCVDDVNVQKGSGRNTPPAPPEIHPSQPALLSCFTSGENDSKENVQLCKAPSPTVLSQEAGSVEVDSISQSVRKHRENINHICSEQDAGQSALEEVVTHDLDNVCQLPSHQQVLPVSNKPQGGSAFSTAPHDSVCSQLQISTGEVTLEPIFVEKDMFSSPEKILPHKKLADLSVLQEELLLETKSDVLDNHMEIVEIDDSDYDDEDNDDGESVFWDNSGQGEFGESRRVTEDIACEENFHTLEMNNLQSSFGCNYLNNISETSQTISLNRYSCQSCGKSYQYKRGLARHKNLECGKEPQYQCPRCDYRCARRYTLKQHMRTRRCQMKKRVACFEGGIG